LCELKSVSVFDCTCTLGIVAISGMDLDGASLSSVTCVIVWGLTLFGLSNYVVYTYTTGGSLLASDDGTTFLDYCCWSRSCRYEVVA